MEGPISSIMVKIIATVDINDTIDLVEETVSLHQLSTIPVLGPDGRCFGIIGEGDLESFRATGRKARAIRAWEICTPRIIEVEADTTIGRAADLLQSSNSHHLVVKEKSVIRGLVSTMDIVENFPQSNYALPIAIDKMP